MKQVYNEKSQCCGCTACQTICPQNAIRMEEDDCGFLYPVINEELCIDCKLCQKVCSFSKPNEQGQFLHSYIVKHKEEYVVNQSRSGGFFTAISDVVLSMGGVVYGAFIDDKFVVRHSRAIESKHRDEMRKSKYVQSNLDGIFDLISKDLKNGLVVLFTGTGCQCDGLMGYLTRKKVFTEKLIICDLVCHSNASPGVYAQYLKYQENKHKSKIKAFYFRDKDKYSWYQHVEKIVFESGKVFYTDEYTNLFFSNDIRLSCYECKYCSLCRYGDITIADCWGGQNKYPEIANEKGASLVLINSPKGSEWFEKASGVLTIRDIAIEDVMQPRFKEAETMSDQYEKFWEDYRNMPFERFIRKYSKNNYSYVRELKRKVVSFIKLPFKK